MVSSFFAVVFVVALGCVAHWLLGNAWNLLFPAIPSGTLAANLLGAYLVGFSIAYFGVHPELTPQWRLLIIMEFLGGLTTFLSFSGGVVLLMRQDRLAMAAHLGGSLLLTFAGMATASLLRTR